MLEQNHTGHHQKKLFKRNYTPKFAQYSCSHISKFTNIMLIPNLEPSCSLNSYQKLVNVIMSQSFVIKNQLTTVKVSVVGLQLIKTLGEETRNTPQKLALQLEISRPYKPTQKSSTSKCETLLQFGFSLTQHQKLAPEVTNLGKALLPS